MDILEIVKKIANNKELSKTEISFNEKAIKRAQERGFNTQSQYNIELRNIIAPNNAQTKVLPIQYKNNDIQMILEKCQHIENATTNFKFPFITNNNIRWGFPDGNGIIESKNLKPYRIATQLDLSLSVLNTNSGDIENQFTQMLVESIYYKVLQTAFSTTFETELNPKGLFANQDIYDISEFADLQHIQKFVDDESDNGLWLISPTAKAKLFKINADSQIFNDSKLLGNEYLFTNLVEDGKICYIDLGKLAIANFGLLGVTVDNFTQKANGNVRITVDAYFDYDIAKDSYLSVGNIISE